MEGRLKKRKIKNFGRTRWNYVGPFGRDSAQDFRNKWFGGVPPTYNFGLLPVLGSDCRTPRQQPLWGFWGGFACH